jgi:NAD(P)-dependent dehydrogenase (short-subunit alcohol dehydrogenase family)
MWRMQTRLSPVVSKAAREIGNLDIVVSNAGVYPSHPFLEMNVKDWDRVMALELASLGIRVNSVSPGIIDLPGGQPLSEDYKQAMTRMWEHKKPECG